MKLRRPFRQFSIKVMVIVIILASCIPVFNQFLLSDAVAITTSQGPLSATASGNCVEDSTSTGTGTVSWTSPANAYKDDTTYATASVDGTISRYIKCTGFGFSLPTGVTVSGVVLGLKRKASGTTNGGIADSQIRLYKAGTIGATNRATATMYTTTDVIENHGGSTDLWGTTWTASDINASNFGAGVAVTKANAAGAALTASVDVVTLTVYYSFNPVFTQSGYRWFNNQDPARVPSIATTWGGTGTDKLYGVTTTSDGGYAVTGNTNSSGAGGNDMLIAKYSGAGMLEWTRTWGGTGEDFGYGIIEASDGGLVVTGNTNLVGGNLDDAYVTKYSSSGTLLWTRVWGGTSYDFAYGITQLTGGDIAIVGNTQSYGTATDTFVARFNNSTGTLNGSIVWGSTSSDYGDNIVATSDGGFAISGHTNSYGTATDAFLAKFTSASVLSWSRIWGGSSADYSYALSLSADGGFLLAGQTNSFGTAGDAYVVKYNSTGTYQWNKVWGGSGADNVQGIIPTGDGGFAITGGTQIAGAGSDDYYISKYDNTDTLSWTKSWGGSGSDIGRGIVQKADGTYALIGETASYGAGGVDAGFVQLDSTGSINGCSSPMCQSITGTATNPTATTSSPTVPSSSIGATSSSQSPTSSPVYIATTTVVGTQVTNDVGSPLNSVAANTATSAPTGSTIVRLRMNLHVDTDPAIAGDYSTFKLQYAAKASTCSASTFNDVTTTSPIAYANPSPGVDGLAIVANANDPTHGSDQLIPQEYNESNATRVRSTILAGQDGVWDYALSNYAAASDTTYCFRMVNGDGAPLTAYAYYPELFTDSSQLTQANYRLYANADSVTPGAPLAAQDTPISIASSTPFRLRQLIAYNSGLMATGTNYKLQVAQRGVDNVCDTSFTNETYTDLPWPQQSITGYPGTYNLDTSVGSVPPNNLGVNIMSLDGQYATVNSGPTSTVTYYIATTNYGFSIPSNATITGVAVNDWGLSDSPSSSLSGTNTALVKNGSVVGSVKIGWFGTTITQNTKGSSSDLWGISLTPADVNASTFGVAESIFAIYDGPAFSATTTSLDAVRMTVYYTMPGSTDVLYMTSNPSVPNNTPITTTGSDPVDGSRTNVAETYVSQNPTSLNTTFTTNQDAMWDYALTSTSGAAGKTYCFRTVRADGSLFTAYSFIPSVTFNGTGGGPTLDQQLRGGQAVVSGTKSPLSF